MPAHTPEDVHALFAGAFNDQDLNALVELYERDAILVVPPDGLHAHGTDAIAAAVAPVVALRPRFRSDVIWKLESDGIALTQVRWTAAGSANGDRIEMSGSGTIVSRRQPDGSWRIVLDNPMSAD